MEGLVQLQKQLVDYISSLFNEGFLNDEFTQLGQLQDESNPEFVAQVVSMFFEDSERHLNELAKSLDEKCINYKNIDAHIHQLKGSSSSIGAQRVQQVCITFKNLCAEKNVEGCKLCLQQVKQEYELVKSRLETLFKLGGQVLAAGGTVPMPL